MHHWPANKGDSRCFLGKKLSDRSDTSDIRDSPKVLKWHYEL
ncbi:MAG: hypothetical protein JWR19_1847 [Pedosphaera sp.]|nr:hypothetical protein [Pedosphaera sp.]